MSTKETLEAILTEMRKFNERLGAVEDAMYEDDGTNRFVGLHAALGKYHHDMETIQASQEATAERFRERHSKIAKRVRRIEQAVRLPPTEADDD